MLYTAYLYPLSLSQNPRLEVDISNQSWNWEGRVGSCLYLGDRDNSQNVPASPMVISAQLSSSKGFPPFSTIFGRNRIIGNGFSIREFRSSILSSVHTLPHQYQQPFPPNEKKRRKWFRGGEGGATYKEHHQTAPFAGALHSDNATAAEDPEYTVASPH
jgi:hypothetical protein